MDGVAVAAPGSCADGCCGLQGSTSSRWWQPRVTRPPSNHRSLISSPTGIDVKPLVAAPLDLTDPESHADEAPVLYEAASCELATPLLRAVCSHIRF